MTDSIQQKILKTASSMFMSFGIKSVSMDDIARNAGISKRTLYENYASKDELLLDVIKDFHQESMQKHSQIANDKSFNSLQTIMAHLFVIVEKSRSVNPVFFFDLERYKNPRLNDIFKDQDSKQADYIIKLLKKGIDEGLVIPTTNIPLFNDILTIMGDTLRHRFTGSHYNFTQIFLTALVPYFRGISTPMGIEVIDEIVKRVNDY